MFDKYINRLQCTQGAVKFMEAQHMKPSDKICVALDVDNLNRATLLTEQLKGYVGMFKIGIQLYTSEGPNVVESIKKIGGKIFLDVKYHDIPNTVANAAKVVTRLGVFMFNIHASGGYEMMARTVEAVHSESEKLKIDRPRILGVTVLTSINESILKSDLKVESPLTNYVLHFARLAQRAGLDGVVASPKDITLLRKSLGRDFIILTPGIRPPWSVSKDDQKRVTTPAEAIGQGSDYIVVGRPIISADNPAEAAKLISNEISNVC